VTFEHYVPGAYGFGYQGSGDITNGNGTCDRNIYGGMFADESFIHQHSKPGVLSMANSDPNVNDSHFLITTYYKFMAQWQMCKNLNL
ncbi:unnamed protein product, partial [Rotaria sp. Silwood1]